MSAPASSAELGSNIVHLDGACAALSIEELEAVHVLQLQRPRDWHLRLVESEEHLLLKPAAVCRALGAGELNPQRIRQAMKRSSRCALREALEPVRHWLADRAPKADASPARIHPGEGQRQTGSPGDQQHATKRKD